MSKIWKIPVYWEMCGKVEIEADTLEEAIEMARNDDMFELPEGEYVDGSFDVSDLETDCIRQCYNNNQPDEPDNFEMTAEEALTDFPSFVEFCDKLKTAYYQCLFIYNGFCYEDLCEVEASSETIAEARRFFRRFEPLPSLSPTPAPDFPELLEHFIKTYNDFIESKSLRNVISLFMEYFSNYDDEFYKVAQIGNYWNEVELPAFVEELFRAYVNELAKEDKTIVTGEIYDGCCAISYYDLSDIEIVFDSETSAKAFADMNGVEPSDFMTFEKGADTGWKRKRRKYELFK